MISAQDYAIGIVVGAGAMYASAVLLSRLDTPLWLRVTLGVLLLSCAPLFIVLAPDTLDWRWLAGIGYCFGFGINQVAAPWRVRTGQAA